MTDLRRYEVSFGGSAVVGPGVSVFYSDSPSAGVAAALRTFYNSISDELGQGLSVNYPSSGDVIDDATGTVVGAWTESPQSATGGNISDGPVMGVGARIEWLTGFIADGRAIRGRTFIVPLARSRFDGAGMLTPACVTTLQAAANALIASTDLRIWRRPKTGRPGTSATVTSALVPDQVSWLRSRRT